MLRRILSCMLVLALFLSACPVAAFAKTENPFPGEAFSDSGTYIPQADLLPDSEELFEAYAYKTLYNLEVSTFGTAAADRLSADEREVYDALVPILKKIASGKRADARIRLGLSADADVQMNPPALSNESVMNIFNALLSDLPYDLYWFDKTSGIYFSTLGVDFGIAFYVARAYRGADSWTANTKKTAAASKAATKAKAIVQEYESCSDYKKLLAYKDKICSLVSYDYSIFNGAYYGDPWQVIHVFDGDSSTNVVCEGYSKALMYLCDLSRFQGDVACYTVTGYMDGGAHMWNIVSIGGKNYMADVTNSDSGTIGANGGLFLTGASGSVSNGYTFLGCRYTYEQSEKEQWGTGTKSILRLSSKDYDPSAELGLKASNISSSGKPKLTWNDLNGAASYEIYQGTSRENLELVKATTSTSYTHTDAEVGITCYYQVKALSSSGSVVSTSGIASRTCDLPRPEVSLGNEAATGKVKISWEPIAGAAGYQVCRATSKSGTYSLLEEVTETTLVHTAAKAEKTYYYKVKAIHEKTAANSAYSEIKSRACDLPQPAATATTLSSSGKIRVRWEKISGAEEYKVYRAESEDGEYKLMKTTTSTSYTNTSAEAGKTYFYKVRAISEKTSAHSAYSAVVSCQCKAARPELSLKNDADSGKILVGWEAVDGAVSYQLFRAASEEGPFELLAEVSQPGYTDTSAEAGTAYYYQLKALTQTAGADSASSEIKYRTCDLPRPEVTITNVASSGKIKLSWTEVPGATEYKIYRATSKGGTYKLLKTTEKLSFTNTSVTAGTTYYYKVKAIHENTAANSAYTPIKSRTCDLAQPEVRISENSKGKPRVRWEAVKGAEEYKVYRSTDGAEWKLMKTTTSTSYTNTSAKEGRTYYYKVRAIAAKSAANSAYSEILTFTVN